MQKLIVSLGFICCAEMCLCMDSYATVFFEYKSDEKAGQVLEHLRSSWNAESTDSCRCFEQCMSLLSYSIPQLENVTFSPASKTALKNATISLSESLLFFDGKIDPEFSHWSKEVSDPEAKSNLMLWEGLRYALFSNQENIENSILKGDDVAKKQKFIKLMLQGVCYTREVVKQNDDFVTPPQVDSGDAGFVLSDADLADLGDI